MTDVVADYQRAADGFSAVLAKAEGKLDRQSPCPEWRAQDVVDHVLGGVRNLVEQLGGTVPADAGDDYDALRAAVLDAARRPGALERSVQGPLGGEMPAGVFLGIMATDTLIHTWDLSRAIGEPAELDAELLVRSWQGIVPMDEAIRRPGVFGPKVELDEGATEEQQALAFFGRDPR